jgi:hypothetical protein
MIGAVVDSDLRALDDDGFALVRGFLGPDDISALQRDFDASAFADNDNYQIKNVGLEPLRRLRPKLDQLAAEVRRCTSVDVDLFNGATYFANEVTNLAWHQEFEPYYLCQDLHNYLNFYMPFLKADPARSNLCVVPWTALRARDAAACARLIDGGARKVEIAGGRALITDSTTGERVTLGFDLESIAVAPALAAGDLLVVRGDVIHRTQDQATRRIAVSMRMARGASEVTRQRLTEGSGFKREVLLKNPRVYACALDHFDEIGTDRSTVERLSRHLRARLPKCQADAESLARRL